MAATVKLMHKAIGAEVRRGTYDVLVDGNHVGSVEMNATIEIPVEPGHHTLRVRSGRNSSRNKTFDAVEDETVAYRCTGKSILPIFLLSFGGSQPGTHAPPRVGAVPAQSATGRSKTLVTKRESR